MAAGGSHLPLQIQAFARRQMGELIGRMQTPGRAPDRNFITVRRKLTCLGASDGGEEVFLRNAAARARPAPWAARQQPAGPVRPSLVIDPTYAHVAQLDRASDFESDIDH